MNSSINSTPNSSSDCPYSYKSYISTPAEIQVKHTWYHGELGQNEANQLLRGLKPGTFLVRRNGSSRFYLSFVDVNKCVQHIPIRQLNSQFFLDGRQFSSLEEAIFSVKNATDPLKRDDFIGDQMDFLESKYLCIKMYDRREVEEMSAEVGDILSVFETDDPEWMMGRNETNGLVGLIPVRNIEPLIMEVEDLKELPYFYDTISTDLVQLRPIGSFLLRRSSKGADTYALLVKTQNCLVEKFLIVGSPSRGFLVAGRPFPTIGHVLNRYCDRAISGGVRLNHAVCVNKATKKLHNSGIQKQLTLMSSSQYDEKPQKKNRIFRGVSIDTAMTSPSSSMAQVSGAISSPSATVSTGVRDVFMYSEEDYNENIHLESTSTIIASTTALRKSREEKQWKECWISLSDMSTGGTSQLAISDGISCSKLRQTIDLSACTVFWLDESVFGVDGCVFISPSYPQQQAVFLCFRPFSSFLKWIRLLRIRSIFQDVPPAMSQSTISYNEPASQMSLLFVEIEKYRSDALKADTQYSANVMLNGVKVCSSNSFAPTSNKNSNDMPVVVIDSKFVLPCVPTCNSTIQLAIVSHSSGGKRGRPCGVSAQCTLSEKLTNATIHHHPAADVGFTFRAQRLRFPVLIAERYRPLMEAIRETPTELFKWPSQVLPQQHRLFLYSCISYMYTLDPINMCQVFRNILNDVLAEATPEDVFRKDSMATGIVTQCLRNLFKTPFDEFLQENSSFSHAVKQQSGGIETATELLVSFVDQSLVTIPLASRLLAIAAECAKRRFEEEGHLIKRTLSALLILRVLNPIIFSTLNNGIGSLLAKSVQVSANAAASKVEDETLTGAASTIRQIFDRMILLANQKEDEAESENNGNSEQSTEWLACVAHLVGYSLTLKPANSSMTNEEVHASLPLNVLELVRLHQ